MTTGVIYGLRAAGDSEIRYIGKTEQEPRLRHLQHLRQAKGNTRHYVCRWITSVDRKIEMIVLEREPVGGLDAAERAWIAYAKVVGCRLTNATPGGEGTAGYKHTEETRRRMSEAQRGNSRRAGHTVSQEQREKIRAALLGRPHSPERIANISAATRGKPKPPRTPEHRARLSDAMKGKQTNLGRKLNLQPERRAALTGTANLQALHRASHLRWHVNRGITAPGCRWCEAVSAA